MREIKFRAWDKSDKKYITWREACVRGIDESTISRCGIIELTNIEESFFIFEQYTGLKDKNRKEVYEGDILKFKGYIFVCEWDIKRASFQFRISSKLATCFHSEYVSEMEIIGNIHEDPELI